MFGSGLLLVGAGDEPGQKLHPVNGWLLALVIPVFSMARHGSILQDMNTHTLRRIGIATRLETWHTTY